MIDLFNPVIVTLPGPSRVHQCEDAPQWAFGNEVHMAQLRAAARSSADRRKLSAEEKRRRKTERMRRLRAGKKATPEQLADMVRDSLVALPAMRHHPAAAFVIATLEPVWPCKPVPARSQV